MSSVQDRRPLATPEELSTFLAVPQTTLRQWRYMGRGPQFSKVGHLVRYRWADVESWLESNRQAVA